MEAILFAINTEIIRLTSKLASERRFPSACPDRMDETINDCQDRIKALRRIRTEIEDVYI